MGLTKYLRRPDSVTVDEAGSLIEAGALVLDVRGEAEWRNAHVPGALLMPIGQIESRWEELPDDRLIITFCTAGFVSSWAANVLTDLGFTAVNLAGGLMRWRSGGRPLEAA